MEKKKKTQKWNKKHKFMRKKSTELVGHPVFVYGERKRFLKYLTFTHTPEKGKEGDYEKLRHNIDPQEDGVRDTYVKKKFDVNRSDAFRKPDRQYRIHPEDEPTIKKYKK